MNVSNHLFGTDGIRGLFGEWPLTPLGLKYIGAGIKRYLSTHGKIPRILFGQDTRSSCPEMIHGLYSGMGGVEVVSLGVVPTPAVSYTTRRLGADMGVMISASHNLSQFNGVKFFTSTGEKLTSEEQETLLHCIQHCSKHSPASGTTFFSENIPSPIETLTPCSYISFLEKSTEHLKGLSLVLDCANGAMTGLAKRVFTACGARVVAQLGSNPDGNNINEGCGALHPQRLAEVVKESGADLGFAFDGDGDRLIVVDSGGKIRDGDDSLALLSMLEPSGTGIVGTCLSNAGLERFLLEEGRALERAQVGDRWISQRLKEKGWNLGGEPCGHILQRTVLPTGDGLLTALKIASSFVHHGLVFPFFIKVPSLSYNLSLNIGAEALSSLATHLDQWSMEHMPEGIVRHVIRASGTEPMVRILLEGETMDSLKTFKAAITAHIQHLGYGGLQ